MKVTIYVDGQPEQFETSVPVSYCLITSTMDAPSYFTTERLAIAAYYEAVKYHRDILATHKRYKFIVSLYEGTTLMRKTSK